MLPNTKIPRLAALPLILSALIFPTLLVGSSTVFYTSRTDFDSAQPGLPVEGFGNAIVLPGDTLLQTSPLSSTTSNSIFSASSILPGLTISNLNPANTPGLIVYGDGAIFGGSKSVGTNWFGDALVMNFGPGVSAVGADVFAATSPGLTLAGDFTADVYNGTTLLSSTTFSEAAGAFGFVGVSSSDPITSMVLLYTTTDATTFADNIAFASSSTPPPPPPSAPEPSTFALGAVAVLFLGFASRNIARHRKS